MVYQMSFEIININIKDFQKWTPLHYAAIAGDVKIIKHLIKDPIIFLNEKNDESLTPIDLAIENGHIYHEENAVILLIERGAKID